MLATATTLNHMPSLTVWHRFTVATLSLYRRHLFTFWQIDLKRANEAWKKLKKKAGKREGEMKQNVASWQPEVTTRCAFRVATMVLLLLLPLI